MSPRTHHSNVLLLGLALLLGIPQLAGAVTLGHTGKAPPPSWFTCHKDIDLIKAGGKPHFKIELRGHCGVHPGEGLPGWTPVDWKKVTVLGSYNYETGATEETIWAGPDIMIEAKLQCDKNPWAHGNACTPTQTVTNNTGVMVAWSYPLSAQRLSYPQRLAIAKWEAAPPAPTLSDWVPYTVGKADVAIVEPTLSNPIPEGSAGFILEVVAPGSAFGPNDRIEFEWQQILPPKDASIEIGGKWVPYSTIQTPKSVLPADFPVNVATFPVRGLYAVRAKLSGRPENTKTDWRMFWIGDPLPGLEQYAKDDQVKKTFTLAPGTKLIVFGQGKQQEMNSAAALRLISRPSSKSPAGLSRIGTDSSSAAPRTSVLRSPSMQGEAMPRLQPMGPVPDSVRTDGKIRTVSPASSRGKPKAAKISPQITPELPPSISQEKPELEAEKLRSAPPVTGEPTPSLRQR